MLEGDGVELGEVNIPELTPGDVGISEMLVVPLANGVEPISEMLGVKTVLNVDGTLVSDGLTVGGTDEMAVVEVELSSPSKEERSATTALETLLALAASNSSRRTQP